MTDPQKRMLSAIYNKSRWDFWTSLCDIVRPVS